MSETGSLGRLLAFLVRLEDWNIHYRLSHHRDDAMMVEIAVPGERWEVEFFDDEHVEIEVFASCGMEMDEEAALERLFAENAT